MCFKLLYSVHRFTSSLIKLKKDMIRLSPYLIADLLKLFSENSIPNFVKVSFFFYTFNRITYAILPLKPSASCDWNI